MGGVGTDHVTIMLLLPAAVLTAEDTELMVGAKRPLNELKSVRRTPTLVVVNWAVDDVYNTT